MTKEKIQGLISGDISKLESLMEITLSENQKFNLTAIKDEESFRELMIYDSLIPLKYFSFDGKKVLDVGTGAGFPGLPLAICSKGNFTLLDSTAKKINHINNVCKTLDINNVDTVVARVEDYASSHRETFDYVIARAVAPLNVLIELCLPLVKVGGSFIAMKGSAGLDELKESKKAIDKIGGEVIASYEDTLPESGEKRILIEIKKIKPTNNKYPRQYSEIKKKPL